MLRVGLHGSSTRWAASVVGCVLIAFGVTASLLPVSASDPMVWGLAVCAAVWLAWVALDFALIPLRVLRAAERQRRGAEIANLPAVFVDTQPTWWSP